MRPGTLLFFGSLLAVSTTHAASLHVCPADIIAPAAHEARVTLPDGGSRRVFVSDAQRVAGCRSIRLPLPAHEIAGLKPVASAAALGDNIILHGPPSERGFTIESVTGSGAQPPSRRQPQPMPLGDDLLPQMQARVFGSEERAQAQLADGRLRLQCGAGSRPAGVILGGPWRMARMRAELEVLGSGDGRFALQVLDAAAAAREEALPLGEFAAGPARPQRLALPQRGYDPASWQAFVIVCPAEAASLQLDALRLQPQPGGIAGRSAWVWDARAWRERPEEVFAHAQRHGLRTLFIAVPVREGRVADGDALSSFLRQARSRGIAVWTVDGDPQMVLPQEHAPSAARARAYAAYNRQAGPDARLQGLQYDVEHYLLPGYELAPAEWDRRYLELARALHDAADGLPLEFVMPFWWADKDALLDALAPLAAGVTVMDYRTRQDEILRFAQPFLDWGVRHGRQVRIALEAGPVAPEQQRRYTRAPAGELWLLQVDQSPVLLLLDEARPNPHGPAFRQVASTLLDGSATTFHAEPQRLLRMLPELERAMSAWTSFNGIALHELK